jgi:ribosomal protein L34E
MSPEQRPQSVATLPAIPSCPICGVPLQGKQTERDAKARLLLRTVLESATEALEILNKP